MRQKCFNFLTYKASNYDIQGDSVGFALLVSEERTHQWSVSPHQQARSSNGPWGIGLVSAGRAAGTKVVMLPFSATGGVVVY